MKKSSLLAQAFGMAAILALVSGCGGANGTSQTGGSSTVLPNVAHTHSGVGPTERNSRWFTYYYANASQIVRHAAVGPVYGTVSFAFRPDVYTAILVTADPSLTGDLTGDTLTDTVSTSGGKKALYNFTGGFGSEPGCNGSDSPPNVRFFFTAGSPIFNFTRYWWSNPVSWNLTQGAPGSATISQSLAASSAGEWSDWNGQPGNYSKYVMTRFLGAVKHVRYIGLSFGCGYFFENGVTVESGRTVFNSQFSESSS